MSARRSPATAAPPDRGAGRSAACPSCRARAARDANKFYPFCSERCQLVDLGRWFGEEFRVPAEPATPPTGSDDE